MWGLGRSGGEEVESHFELGEWQTHVLANLPFYSVLFPAFLDLTLSRVSSRGDSALADLLKVQPYPEYRVCECACVCTCVCACARVPVCYVCKCECMGMHACACMHVSLWGARQREKVGEK